MVRRTALLYSSNSLMRSRECGSSFQPYHPAGVVQHTTAFLYGPRQYSAACPETHVRLVSRPVKIKVPQSPLVPCAFIMGDGALMVITDRMIVPAHATSKCCTKHA